MDLKGPLVDTHLNIYPSENFITFIQTLTEENYVPENIRKFFKNPRETKSNLSHIKINSETVQFTDKDYEDLAKIKEQLDKVKSVPEIESLDDSSEITVASNNESDTSKDISGTSKDTTKASDSTTDVSSQKSFEEIPPEREGPFLHTSDIDWLYIYLEKKRKIEKNVPYLHELFEGTDIEAPRNTVLKRNPVLEARCVKLRSQQEAREYRKMTKSVDNVRIRFPDDSINYQLKQINRQLIAIGQFILSIFAGFLFGFKGVEWMIGPLDFGFKLLLGVMCALIIALAEIYFLAKKLNEELNVPETVQLGGPPQFVDKKTYTFEPRANNEPTVVNKEHQD